MYEVATRWISILLYVFVSTYYDMFVHAAWCTLYTLVSLAMDNPSVDDVPIPCSVPFLFDNLWSLNTGYHKPNYRDLSIKYRCLRRNKWRHVQFPVTPTPLDGKSLWVCWESSLDKKPLGSGLGVFSRHTSDHYESLLLSLRILKTFINSKSYPPIILHPTVGLILQCYIPYDPISLNINEHCTLLLVYQSHHIEVMSFFPSFHHIPYVKGLTFHGKILTGNHRCVHET